MIYADTATELRTTATPGARGTCPGCSSEVIAKCGSTITWHWAHAGRDDCDEWAERDSTWHRAWQDLAPASRREVIMGDHRADLVTHDHRVIELQHSPISADVIAERERHYGPRMIWIFDAIDAYTTGRLEIRSKPGGEYVSFRWRHPRKTVAACRRIVLLDLDGHTLLRLGRMHPDTPCGGWGHLLTVDAVRSWITADGYAEIEAAA